MVAVAERNCPPQDEVVEVINPAGKGDFLLACEHASSFIPPEYKDLGLGDDVLNSHVAWDPGALAVAEKMSAQLDAPLVAQRVSRLVYDCNRPPASEGAMPERSEIFDIPGNVNLTESQQQARINQYYIPFHQKLSTRIDRHIKHVLPPVLLTVHSFTPVYYGTRRNLDIGILHDTDSSFADALLAGLENEARYIVARNEPYGPADGVTHTLVQQALPRGLMNVMIEIRNDIIDTPSRQQEMAEILSLNVVQALAGIKAENEKRGAR